MPEPWPPGIMETFFEASLPRNYLNGRNTLSVAYLRLFVHLFPIGGPCRIMPRWRVRVSSPYARLGATLSPFAVITEHFHPMFFVDVQPASEIELRFRRSDADARMRSYFRDYREETTAPYLYGASAFGSRLCLYKYTRDTNILEPAMIPANPAVLHTDVAPSSRWDCDLLDADGAARFREVAQSVLQMCENNEVEEM